jgi:hypothetical protein
VVEHGIDCTVGFVFVVGPQLDRDTRAHDAISDALDPFGMRGNGKECQQRQIQGLRHGRDHLHGSRLCGSDMGI